MCFVNSLRTPTECFIFLVLLLPQAGMYNVLFFTLVLMFIDLVYTERAARLFRACLVSGFFVV